jgi:peptide/nickel transport system substrate-binding protein
VKKVFIILVVMLVCLSVAVGCSSSATTTTPAATSSTTTSVKPPETTSSQTSAAPTTAAKQYGGTLRLITGGSPGSPIGWIPESTGISADVQSISMDMLLLEDLKGNMVPSLASSFQLNTDPANPSITFQLRKGVKFHDGTDFNAQTVKWDFEQVKANPMSMATTRNWKSFDVLDDYTIRVNYVQWQNQLMRPFNSSACMMFSPTAYQKNGVEWNRWNMVGTGPFKQTDFQKDVTLKAVRNDNYWDTGKPYLNGLEYVFVADELTQVATFKTGGGETLVVSPKNAVEFKSAGYEIITRLRNTNLLLPDSANADSPWSNLKVRQAADYAIDKEAIAKTFGYGYWQAAYQIAPPNSPAYVSSLPGRKYDVAKAKQLLSEAGYPNGFKTKIICGNNQKDINAAYQAYYAAVGIQAELDIADPGRAQQLMSGGTWNNALLNSGCVLLANFNNVLSLWFGEPATFFKSSKHPEGYAALLSASLNSPSPDPALMQKCVQALYDDCSVLTTAYDTHHFVLTNKIHDTGIGQWGGFTMWSPANAWMSK